MIKTTVSSVIPIPMQKIFKTNSDAKLADITTQKELETKSGGSA
jgi:hypothetical protein